ncbi:MAG TPA: hypothetical protein VFU41_14320 [Gemmatimonadales bacterium]|nr:hypothetical protein [Gemmatimonadales bacterium]
MADRNPLAGLPATARARLPEKAEELAQLLATGTWTHDYPITFEEAKRRGLKVTSDMLPEILQLMSLFPQPARRQPSVEYLPYPRRRLSGPDAAPSTAGERAGP